MHHSADIEFVCTRYCHPAVCDLLILFQIAKLEKIFRLRRADFSGHNRERKLVVVIFVVTCIIYRLSATQSKTELNHS